MCIHSIHVCWIAITPLCHDNCTAVEINICACYFNNLANRRIIENVVERVLHERGKPNER